MKKPELIEQLMKAVRTKANCLTEKQLNDIMDNHPWISKRKRRKS